MFSYNIFVDEGTWLWIACACEEAGINSLVDNHDGEFWMPCAIEFLDLANDLREFVVGYRLELAVTNSISKDEDVVRLASSCSVISLE